MAVYVDNMEAGFGNMVMCHMIADTTDELLAMADKIGVNRKWIQDKGTYQEHFDICLTKRKLAVQGGTVELTMRELSSITTSRPGSPFESEYDKYKESIEAKKNKKSPALIQQNLFF